MARTAEKHIFGVSDRLTLAIKRSGLTLEELEEKTGVLAAHISSMMHGNSTMHEFSMARLCVALNVSADWILGLTVSDARRTEVDGTTSRAEVERKVLLEAASKFAGHSDYHGDTILSKLICMAEGKEVKKATPIPYFSKTDFQNEIVKDVLGKLEEAIDQADFANAWSETGVKDRMAKIRKEYRLSPSLDKIDIDDTFETILICAERYALGRRSYMPLLVVDFIRPLLPKLSLRTLTVFERDISDTDCYGDEQIDKPMWLNFLSLVRTEISKRSEDNWTIKKD